MKKVVLVLSIGFIGLFQSVLAQQYLLKPITFQANSILRTDSNGLDLPMRHGGSLIANGSSFTTNGTSLTDSRPVTLGNGTTLSKTTYGTSANQVLVLTLTRFALPGLKSAGGAQANGALLVTLPAGAQIIPGGALSSLKLFTSNGAAAIKSNGTVLALGSVKAAGAVRLLTGTATFYDILTGQQIQQNGRTLNAAVHSTYATATSGVKTVYLNTANGYPAASVATQFVNGTISIPIINAY